MNFLKKAWGWCKLAVAKARLYIVTSAVMTKDVAVTNVGIVKDAAVHGVSGIKAMWRQNKARAILGAALGIVGLPMLALAMLGVVFLCGGVLFVGIPVFLWMLAKVVLVAGGLVLLACLALALVLAVAILPSWLCLKGTDMSALCAYMEEVV
jgi:hypothetical protein